MPFCHGQGEQAGTHCCYVDGAVCPRYMDNATLVAWINATYSGTKRARALAMAQGVVNACSIAVRLIADNGNLINNRKNFENAWNTDAEYLAAPRPSWAALEQRNGLPPGSFQCSTWQGSGAPQCCWGEDEATNAAKAANLHASAVTVRKAGGTNPATATAYAGPLLED